MIVVDNDISRKIIGMNETGSRSSAEAIEPIHEAREEYAGTGDILESITDHGTEFYAKKQDKHGEVDHAFETYLAENHI